MILYTEPNQCMSVKLYWISKISSSIPYKCTKYISLFDTLSYVGDGEIEPITLLRKLDEYGFTELQSTLMDINDMLWYK